MTIIIPTHLPSLDLALGGGIEGKSIYLVHGPGGAGKTQLLFWFVVAVLRVGGSVFWIETDGFPVLRLLEVVKAQGIQDGIALNNLHVREVRTLDAQERGVEAACLRADANHRSFGLVVVDSFTGTFRQSLGTAHERESLESVGMQMSALREVTRAPRIAVAVSGQVWTDFETGRTRPIGERTLDGWPDVTIRIDRRQNGDRAVTVDRRGTGIQEVSLRIAAEGLREVVPHVAGRGHPSADGEQHGCAPTQPAWKRKDAPVPAVVVQVIDQVPITITDGTTLSPGAIVSLDPQEAQKLIDNGQARRWGT